MKRKWLIILVLVVCGIGFAYKFLPASMRERLCQQGQGEKTLSASVSKDIIVKTKEKDISITQYMFTGGEAEIKDLWALDDHGIAQAVWFYATYGSDFIAKDILPSMFSCEDVNIEQLKQWLRWKCRWYGIKYKPFSFIFQASTPLFFLENGKIYLKNNEPQNHIAIEIAQYNIGEDFDFSGVIEQSEVWLDKKYCLKPYDFWNSFRYLRLSWTAGLGYKFNRLYNEGKLQMYNIHELIDGKCKNNTPWIVIYEEWSHKFYTVISNDPNISVIYYDWIYSTPFSIDIE